VAVSAESIADVGDDVGRQVGGVELVDLGTFAGFDVGGLAGPAGGGEEHADVGQPVGVGVVAEVGEGEVGGVDGDAEFLARFAGCSGGEGSPSSRDPPGSDQDPPAKPVLARCSSSTLPSSVSIM
jgi:hypothetical protein